MIKFSQKKLVICQISLANNIPVIKENYYNFSKLYNNLLFFIICPNKQLKIFKKHLNKKNIIIIGEDKIIKFSKFKRLFFKYSKNQIYRNKLFKRLNWYYQQIIKISFIINNKICKKNNLVLWDADTLILKKIDFFKKHKSINYANVFEYHRPYFLTCEKLLNTKIPRKYLSSINQFIAISPQENKFIKSKFRNNKTKSINSEIIFNKVIQSIYSGNKDFNHSMFSEYETFGLCNYLKYRDFQQTTIFFLRYKISGRLSNFQKKICKIFNCKHVTYEEHGSNKLRKSILYKDQKMIPFMMIILRQYIKFFGRKLRYLFT